MSSSSYLIVFNILFNFIVVITFIPISLTTNVAAAETETETKSEGHIARYIANANSKGDGLNSLIPSIDKDQQGSNSNSVILHHKGILKMLRDASKDLKAEFSSIQEMADYFDKWEAPEEIRKNYTYYFAGRDEDNRPIWAGELGRWDLRAVMEAGEDTLKIFRKHVHQFVYRIICSLERKATPEDFDPELPEVVLIADFDELSIRQVGHVPTVTEFLRIAAELQPLLLKHVSSIFVLNANFMTERLMELLRPVVGAVFEKIEIYGTNSARWIPRLLRKLPKDQLPKWYGGVKDFKPLAVYG